MNKVVAFIVIAAIVAFAAYFLFFNNKEESKENQAADDPLKGYTKKEIIMMGDQRVSWDNLYKIGTKLGLSKTQVNSIVNYGRPVFSDWASTHENWESDLVDIFMHYQVPYANN